MSYRGRTHSRKVWRGILCVAMCCGLLTLAANAEIHTTQLHLQPTDVLPTGNEWISLPDIRASDGALGTFNVLSMRHRGLLQVAGAEGSPVITPSFTADGKSISLHNPNWSLVEYWSPVAHQSVDGLDLTLTWCAPPDARAAFLRLTLTNRRQRPVEAKLGMQASWGSLSRVTYTPVPLKGNFTAGLAPWVADGEVFSFSTTDTDFAWSLVHPGSQGVITLPPNNVIAPTVDAERTQTLHPGQQVEALYVIGAGIEEFSAPHNAKALREMLDREGADALIAETAAWCAKHTRTTGDAKIGRAHV